MIPLEKVYTPHIERVVCLRADPVRNDRQVWADTFTGLYHVPPERWPAPATVLDLGANIGLVSAHYAYLWPEARIVAVEMDKENAMIAHLNFDGRVLGYAVGDTDKPRAYDQSVAGDAYHLGRGSGRAVGRRLSSILTAVFPDGCDLVKMDIEGAEWEVLGDGEAWAPLVHSLIVELHPTLLIRPGRLLGKAADRLAGLGYNVSPSTHPRGLFAYRPSRG